MLSTHKFITIYGPTASGKTDLAIRLAEVTRGVIINFDTCQFRNYLPSLTMCPSPSLSIKEYLFNFLSPGDIFTVDDYFNKLQEILMEENNSKVKILVGGSGFYLFCLLNGLGEEKFISDEIHRKVDNNCEKANWQQLQFLDKNYSFIHMNDTYRIKNHLKFHLQYGHSMRNVKYEPFLKAHQTYNIFLNPPRDILKERINKRTNIYFNAMCTEVEEFHTNNSHMENNKIIGYKTISNYLRKTLSQQEAIHLINIETSQYAKRQITFKNKLNFHLTICKGEEIDSHLPIINNFIYNEQ